MNCERFKKLLKTWYIQVQSEALAPARMVIFMKQHVAECQVCLTDPGVRHEVEKITEIVLPPAKVRVLAPNPREEDSFPVNTGPEEPEGEEEGDGEDREEDEDLDESDAEEEDGEDF